jgi:hypothetical protein
MKQTINILNRKKTIKKRKKNNFKLKGGVIFIVAPCILKIHLSHTNKCTNYVIYYLISV